MTGWDRSEFTSAAGTRVHAAVLGPATAPAVVCVHGLGVSHRYFLPLARRLATTFQVVVPDLPGFGRTPGPPEPLDVRGLSLALAAWLRATAREGSPLVANSAGCQVVVDLAVHAPELLGPIVLNGPTVDRHARSRLRQLSRFAVNSPLERSTLNLVVTRDYLDCGLRRLVTTFRYVLDDPIERKLHRVRTPAVVVRGSRDRIVPREWAREVTALLPRGRLAEVPGAGHTLNYSAPAELSRITRSLLLEATKERNGEG